MIHIFVGTKAQLIKMMPIMRALDRRGVSYNFINTGQHAGLTADLIRQFGLRQPDVFMRKGLSNISSLTQAIAWTAGHFLRLTFQRRRIWEEIFKTKDGICLIHGDTLSTLIALLYAKRCGQTVAHIEAGLRSFNLFDPFPEEIIRLIAMHFSDLLLAPSDWAFENLCSMGYRSKAVNIGANTGLEAVAYAADRAGGHHRLNRPSVVVTIHRVETIYSRSRLMMVAALIQRIARDRKVMFILHEPTRRQLVRFDLLSKITQLPNVTILPLLSYLEFVDLLAAADYVVTDGGSVQEECYYLNKPCMIMRSKTERIEGLGENALLTAFDQNKIERFFKTFPALKRKDFNEDIHPSGVIVDHLLQWV